MKKKVTILEPVPGGNHKELGAFTWDGQKIIPEPYIEEEYPLFDNLLQQGMFVPDEQDVVTAEQDPEKWLDHLYLNVTSPYLWATRSRAVDE